MKRLAALLMVLMLCLSMAGCNMLFDDSYISVKPYMIENPGKEGEEIVADSYVGVRQALVDLVQTCAQSAIISIPSLDEKLAVYYISAARDYVMHNTALGAYAVKEIDYEIGTNVGELAIAVEIAYNYNRVEIMRITRVESNKEAVLEIHKALQQCDADITLHVQNYEDADLIQLVQDYADYNPHYCMEMPQVTVSLYPETGRERILSMTFSYRNSREVLRGMQSSVNDVFSQIEPEGNTRWDRYANIYEQLMQRHENYTLETSITPSYSLLRHGVGDSKAFATVYAAICRARNLNCEVISGTKVGEAWYWNVVKDNGVYYHIDLLRCREEGQFHRMDEADMAGYVWDYSAYPGNATKPTEYGS